METLSTLTAFCEGNPTVTSQRAGNADFGVFFNVKIGQSVLTCVCIVT